MNLRDATKIINKGDAGKTNDKLIADSKLITLYLKISYNFLKFK